MSLRERFRKHRGPAGDAAGTDRAGASRQPDGDDAPGATRAGEAGQAARTEITDFEPRPDGDYHCPEHGLYLRFARPAVTETSDAHPDPARGEFTAAGRFTVHRPFERPVVYTVLEAGNGSLTVRRTDTSGTGPASTAGTGPASTADLTFTFEPDEG